MTALATRIARLERRYGPPLPEPAPAADEPAPPLLPWRDWLTTNFAPYVRAPFAPRHIRVWDWLEALTPGDRPRPRIEVWPRGGAKSSTAELGCARLSATLRRRFVLYVSETQEQANKHVQSIAGMLERLGTARAVNEYGYSRGWRHHELRTAGGFNVTAFGLDAGMRGVKLDEVRPDMIVCDDIDALHDTAATRGKKLETLTKTVLPSGAADCAVLVIQNKVYPESIVASLAEGTADFLVDREPAAVEPAVLGLAYARVELPDGGARFVITAGSPTWAGQDLAVCAHQINTWGLAAFEQEAQHETALAGGAMLRREWFRIVPAPPPSAQRVRYWDLAGSEPLPGTDPDYTAGALVCQVGDVFYLADIAHTRADPAGVDALLAQTNTLDPPDTTWVIEQEPGAAGIHVIYALRKRFPRRRILADRATGKKAVRARPFAALAGTGKVVLTDGAWNQLFLQQAVAFPDDRVHDDLVDAAVGGVTWLERRPQGGQRPPPSQATRRLASARWAMVRSPFGGV